MPMGRSFLGILAFAALFFGQDAPTLPSTPAESLAGQKLTFPDALRGQPAVCVFGFDRDADRKLRAWLDPLARDGVNIWAVAHVGGVPLVHDVVRINLRRGTTPAQQARILVMTQDAKMWKDLLGVQDDDRPVVVVLDSLGRAVWKEQAGYSKMAYKKVKTQLAKAQ